MHTLAADRSWVEAEPALNCFRLKVFFFAVLQSFYVSWYNVSFEVKADNML
jgi:hypothetical protein